MTWELPESCFRTDAEFRSGTGAESATPELPRCSAPEIFMDLGSTPSNESCRLIVWARPKDAGVCNDSYFLSNSSAREVVFSDRLQRGCPKTRNPGALVPQEAVRELLGDGEVARALVFLHRSKKVVGGTAHFLLVPLRNYSWTFCPPQAMKVASSSCGLDRRSREFTTTYRYFLSNSTTLPAGRRRLVPCSDVSHV